MASVDLIFTVDDSAVEAYLDKLTDVISTASITEWLDVSVETYLHDRASKRFAAEGDDVTGSWAPLSPYTIADRLAQGYNEGPILHRTGALENFVTNSQGEIVSDEVSVTLTTPGPAEDAGLALKFAVHQTGSSKMRIPARPMLGINEQDVETILESLTLHITEGLSL